MNRSAAFTARKQEVVQDFKRHPADVGSPEVVGE